MKVSGKELHEHYLEATKKIDQEAFNQKAQKPFEEMTKDQRFIDDYIAQQINKKFDWLKSNIEKLLNQVGQPGKCRGCGKKIWWVTHENGNTAPYTEEALNHFADCPKAERFRRSGNGN